MTRKFHFVKMLSSYRLQFSIIGPSVVGFSVLYNWPIVERLQFCLIGSALIGYSFV